MADLSEKELLIRLRNLDDETLYFMSKYASARRRSVSKQAWITASIATAAGVALTTAYFFPLASLDLVSLFAALIGVAVALASVLQQRRSEAKLIHELLERAEIFSRSESTSESKKRELIEEIMKSGGLQ